VQIFCRKIAKKGIAVVAMPWYNEFVL